MNNDLDRLRAEYADRNRRLAGSDIYSRFNAANLFGVQQRQRVTADMLRKRGMRDLSRASILEMGCGAGGVLTEFLSFGAMPRNLYGIDILEDRLARARQRLPTSHLINADGQRLPFPDHSFDIVLQYTALSSILEEGIKRGITKDMLRVLKPEGFILWYDFWWNPTNRQTRGILPREIKSLFPNCAIDFLRITLAPPIARRIVPVSWIFAAILEKISILNSHYLAVICPLSRE